MSYRLLAATVAVVLLPVCSRAQPHPPARPALVPPADEITILDPGTHPEGKPSPILYHGADGQQRIDVPPTVIVHNFYYNGDRSFRGPVFRGGPSVVVVAHPITGERQYLDVQMYPGSPRITYRKAYIDYDFGDQSIRLRFLHPLTFCCNDHPTVMYRRGHRFVERAERPIVHCAEHTRQWVERTGIPHAVHSTAHATRNAVDSSADAIHAVGSAVAAPVVRVVEATPLGGLVDPDPTDRARTLRDLSVRQAARNNRFSDATIGTLR